MSVKLNCLTCQKEFFVKHSRSRKAKFCSLSCYWKSMNGKPHPHKVNTELIKKNSNITKNWFKKGQIPHNLKNPQLKTNSPSLVYVLGVIYGDGHMNPESVILKTIDFDFATKFKKELEEWSGLVCKEKIVRYDLQNSKWHKQFKIALWSKKVSTFLQNVKVEDILKDETTICNFLRGFYDSESSVSKSTVNCSNTDINKINLVKSLLGNMGIQTHVVKVERKRKNPNWSNLYRLDIYGKQNIKVFYQKVNFSILRKQKALSELIK